MQELLSMRMKKSLSAGCWCQEEGESWEEIAVQERGLP